MTTKPDMPTQEQINIAVHWLQSNEGDVEEQAACEAVADWINALVFNAYLLKAAREAGVPVAKVRKKLLEKIGE
jgi:hypothetical protein